jgi:hypothetical protein
MASSCADQVLVSRRRGEAGHWMLERLGKMGIPIWGGGETRAHQDGRSTVR